MAVGNVNSLFRSAARELLDFDVDATTTGAAVGWRDLSNYGRFAVGVKPSVFGGAGVTRVKILASAASDGSSPEVIADSGVVVGDSINDQVWLETSAEKIRQVGEETGKALRYVSALVIHAHAGDESVVYYERAQPRHDADGLTATLIT